MDAQTETIYCGVPTTGKLHWGSIVFKTVGRPLDLPDKPFDKKQINIMKSAGKGPASHYSAEQIKEMLQKYRRVLIVEHPLSRLLASYLMRVDDLQWMTSPGPLRYFRTDKTYFKKQVNVTFNTYLQYVLEKMGKSFDRHTMTFLEMCMPCAIQYDDIYKVETISVNQTDLYSKDSILRLRDSSPVQSHVQLMQYEDIDKSNMEELIRHYEYDMDMFGYEWDDELLVASCQQKVETGKICC